MSGPSEPHRNSQGAITQTGKNPAYNAAAPQATGARAFDSLAASNLELVHSNQELVAGVRRMMWVCLAFVAISLVALGYGVYALRRGQQNIADLIVALSVNCHK